MINIVFIILQCIFLFPWMYSMVVSPIIVGTANKLHSKTNKKHIYVIALVINFLLFFGGFSILTFADKDNIALWYGFTLITVVLSNYILLNTSANEQPVKNPIALRDYIYNAKCENFNGKGEQFLLKSKFVIYLWYILLMILNQIGSLSENIFSNSLYLQMNEYSLIILFAIKQAVEEYRKSVKK